MPVTLQSWTAATAPPFHSVAPSSLRYLTQALTRYLQQTNLVNLEDLAREYSRWRNMCPQDYDHHQLQPVAQELLQDITTAKNANVVISGTARALNTGYGQVVQDPYANAQLGAGDPTLLPPFTPGEIKYINEAFHRCKTAVDKSLEVMAGLRSKIGKGGVAPLTPLEQAALPVGANFARSSDPAIAAQWEQVGNDNERVFVRLFGPLTDSTRPAQPGGQLRVGGPVTEGSYARVHRRLSLLKQNFDNSSFRIVDGRNNADPSLANAFAYTYRPVLLGIAGDVTSQMLVYLARAFFPTRAYGGGVSALSVPVVDDATIVTLIHEVAHGCFNASDVPCVGSPEFMHGGNPGGLDPQGMPPPGASPSNDLVWDMLLAAQHPALAMENADNYGNFVYACRRA
jgi:hypothetical protein